MSWLRVASMNWLWMVRSVVTKVTLGLYQNWSRMRCTMM